MPVFVKIVKNNNAESAAYGKHYGKVVSSQTMTYRELIKHIIICKKRLKKVWMIQVFLYFCKIKVFINMIFDIRRD